MKAIPSTVFVDLDLSDMAAVIAIDRQSSKVVATSHKAMFTRKNHEKAKNMNSTAIPVLYDLISTDGNALSPWCWHARMALAHKGIDVDRRAHCFTDKADMQAAGGKSFPLLVDTDGTALTDSMDIVMHLEASRPDPTLFPGGDVSSYLFMHRYVQTIMFPTMAKIILVDIPGVLNGEDKAYFIESREARFGKPLSEVCADPEGGLKTLDMQLDPFRKAMAEGGFVAGSAPAMADYLLFGVLQWARVCSPRQLTAEDDVIANWMETMLDLFDGLGRSAKARA